MKTNLGYVMSIEEQQIFNDSVNFIRKNFDIKTNQLPEYLLMLWIAPPCNGDYSIAMKSQLQQQIFTVIYSIYRLRHGDVEWKEEDVLIGINIEEYTERYSYFQTLLHFEHMHRQDIMDFEPINLFHFEKYVDSIEVIVHKDRKEDYDEYMKQWL